MNQGNPPDGFDGGDGRSGAGFRSGEGGAGYGQNGRGQGPGRNNKKRRRQRPQRPNKHRKGISSGKESGGIDFVNRERIFQHIEGLLRQIREQAEEVGGYTEEQLSDYTQAVTAFTRALEEEGDLVSDRVRSEYLRVRDKLTHALRG